MASLSAPLPVPAPARGPDPETRQRYRRVVAVLLAREHGITADADPADIAAARDDVQRLCSMLGLDAPDEHAPGCCRRCGQELPQGQLGHGLSTARRRGLCLPCWRGEG